MKRVFLSILVFFVMIFCCSFVNAADSVKWKFTKKITVYIPNHSKATMMKHAFAEWTQKTNGKIVFYYVPTVGKADINVVFVDKIQGRSDRAIGLTKSSRYGNQFDKVEIQIANKTSENTSLGNDAVYTVMLHEIGYSLGLLEHSNDRLSIMYPTEDDRQEISNNDLNRLKNLYGW